MIEVHRFFSLALTFMECIFVERNRINCVRVEYFIISCFIRPYANDVNIAVGLCKWRWLVDMLALASVLLRIIHATRPLLVGQVYCNYYETMDSMAKMESVIIYEREKAVWRNGFSLFIRVNFDVLLDVMVSIKIILITGQFSRTTPVS